MHRATPATVSASGVTFVWSSWFMDCAAHWRAPSVYTRFTRSSVLTRSAADVGHLDLGKPGCPGGSQVGIPIGARAPDRRDGRLQLGLACAAPDERAQVMALAREEAREEAPLGGDPGSGACAAEGASHRGDDSDLALSVAIAVALGDLPRIGRVDRLQGPLRLDKSQDLSGRDDVVEPPAVRGAD